MKLDGREVQIGDKLYSLIYGDGEVTGVGEYICCSHNTVHRFYTKEGTFADNTAMLRVLFWSKPEFQIPPPPKQKIKKWKWVIQHGDEFSVTYAHYSSKKDVQETAKSSLVLHRIEESMIEVEE